MDHTQFFLKSTFVSLAYSLKIIVNIEITDTDWLYISSRTNQKPCLFNKSFVK